jgi:hypothetical protein
MQALSNATVFLAAMFHRVAAGLRLALRFTPVRECRLNPGDSNDTFGRPNKRCTHVAKEPLCCSMLLVLFMPPVQTAFAQEVSLIACVVPVTSDTGFVRDLYNLPGGRVLIGAKKGLFLASEANGMITVAPAGNRDIGYVHELANFPAVGVLIAAQNGLFLARETNGTVGVTPAGNKEITGVIRPLGVFPGAGMLIGAENGLFLAREANGMVSVTRAGKVDTGNVYQLHGFPGRGILIGAHNGLFLARDANGIITVAPAGNRDIGFVHGLATFRLKIEGFGSWARIAHGG